MRTIWKLNFIIFIAVVGIYLGLAWYNHQSTEAPLPFASSDDGLRNSKEMLSPLQGEGEVLPLKSEMEIQYKEDAGIDGVTPEERQRYRVINSEIREASRQRDKVIQELNAAPDDPYIMRALEEADTRLYQLQSEASYLDEKIRSPQSPNESDL